MTKKKTPKAISKDQFETAKHARIQNIENHESWLVDKRYELEAYELKMRELQIKKEKGVGPVNPVYQYELSDAWTDYMNDVLDLRIKETQLQLDAGRDAIKKTEDSLKAEKLRLRLIEQGIPAWYDHEFEKHQKKSE